MHCIQGSDTHRLNRDPRDRNALGVGDRVTEVLLPEVSFEALKAVFLGDDFARTRPYRPAKAPFDHVRAAREQGPSIVLSFHESMAKKGGRLHAIVCDVVAFANANGGIIYVGARADPKVPPVSINNPEEAIGILKAEIQRRVTPPLDVAIDSLTSEGKRIIRLVVPKGSDVPYAVDGTKIYVRSESETSLALRDEIMQIVQRKLAPPQPEIVEEMEPGEEEAVPGIEPPKTGVEILETVERKGTLYHTVKDLRNGNVVQNVTRSSARKLWRYAITQQEQTPVDSKKITWHGDIGFWKTYKRGGKVRYNLAQRDPEGKVHIYYGVTEEGFHGEWRRFLEGE